jgi:hypothetical protein
MFGHGTFGHHPIALRAGWGKAVLRGCPSFETGPNRAFLRIRNDIFP